LLKISLKWLNTSLGLETMKSDSAAIIQAPRIGFLSYMGGYCKIARLFSVEKGYIEWVGCFCSPQGFPKSSLP